MAKNIKLTENNAKKSPQGGVLVGKKDGQTIIYDDGKVGGWFVGKTHKEGGIQGIDKTTGQPIEVQTGEVIITAPALADQTPREFQGKMLTNRQILSKINSDAGGVAFAEDGMEIPSKILFKGGSYKYGGKMMSDKEIADEINKCGCDHDEKKHLSEGMSLEDIAKKHGVTLEELDKQVEIGMEDESIHAGDYKDHFNIVKDHLAESPTFYTDEQKAQGKNEKFVKGGELEIGGNYRIKNNFGSFSTIKIMPIDENLRTSKDFFSVEVTVRAKDGDNIKIRKNPLTTYPISKYNSFMEDLEKRNPIKFNKGGEMKKENLVKDAKDGNTPARDLNNYNDMLDVQADGQVGGDSGIYKEGGEVGADFTFLKSNPMQRARAITVLEKKIRHDGNIMSNYEFLEGLPKDLEVGVSKLHSRKTERGYVEKLSIGNFIVDAKAEIDYYQYLQANGYPYSKYIKEVKEAEAKKNEADKIIRDEQQKIKELKDIENYKNSEIAKKNQIKELIEKGANIVIKQVNAPRLIQIEKYKTQRQTESVKQEIDYHTRMIEQTERQVKNAYDIASKLYEIVNGEVQPKYNWNIGDKVKVEGYINHLPAEIETEIVELKENRFGEIAYRVESKEGIANSWISYNGLYPITENQEKKEYEYVLTQRPFGIGTYPTENFIRFEDKDYQYGVLVYSQKVPLKDVEHYSLSPITELKEYDDKTLTYLLGKLKIKAKVKLVEDKRKGYFVNVFFYDSEGIQKTQMMSGVNFLKQVQEGKFLNELEKENNYENKTLDELREIHKNKYSNMPIESSKSDDEKLLDKLIAEKFSLMNQEVREKREEKKSFESEGSTEGKGKLYEFFTPQIVADKMLALAQHYGFKGGNVLEPATGSGRLIKNLKDSNITAFEISKDNFEILKREFPNAELYNFNFEKAFLNPPRFNTLVNRKGTETWLKNAPFDLVLANPPYKKEFVTFYSSYFNFKGNLEHFFILQTLYLLKKGGLGVYLIPSSFMRNGIAYNETKKKIFEIAELVDAYRLPSNIFEKTQIGTDILILRKK